MCQNADDSCNTFDAFNGNCRTCKVFGHIPNGRVCVALPSSLNCEAGTYEKDGNCVPDKCTGVDSNGDCSGCKLATERPEGKTCVLKTCPGALVLDNNGDCVNEVRPGFQFVRGQWYKIPDNCLGLSPHLTCTGCEAGYHFSEDGSGECIADGGATNLSNNP